jgi:hypothetical protein
MLPLLSGALPSPCAPRLLQPAYNESADIWSVGEPQGTRGCGKWGS